MLNQTNQPGRTSAAPGGSSGSSCEHFDPAAPRPCSGHPEWSVESPTAEQKREVRAELRAPVHEGTDTCCTEIKEQIKHLHPEILLELVVVFHLVLTEHSYLVVGVVKVHRLTESHFSFRPQVVQLDRSRELQDPTKRKRGQRSGGCSNRPAQKVMNLVDDSPFLPLELELYSDIVLWKVPMETKKMVRQQNTLQSLSTMSDSIRSSLLSLQLLAS